MGAITLCDVGPRDGLQNESMVLSVDRRAQLCVDLASAGLPRVEAVSFVSEARVPQMADAEEVVRRLPQHGTAFSALVLNRRGFDRAIAAGLREIHYALPVTDAYASQNQRMTVADGVELAHELALLSRNHAVRYTVTLSAAFGCPFDGPVSPDTVERVAESVVAAAPDEIVLADTIGVGVPTQVTDLVGRLRRLGCRVIGCHFHNTRNTGLANAVAALEAGVTVLDASVGGAGGCPFAPKASGNVATEDLVYMLEHMGIDTGVDLDRLIVIARGLGEALGHEMPGMVMRAGSFPSPPAA